ncbi:hypothetical protein [Cellvibrio sp. KY-YJ-3]|uniref:hypothetical protein n=1 Tax=Cellvibrio sp. KY-YJ-3 TaxID=454662 RepID=UPI001247598B|nr:hypothetical protein [Cellvibrio sp. KY-YJ-3]QEY12322.1 hypothetical protein D0B88_08680 [Cellvibrio sp. KY-YJ-3]
MNSERTYRALMDERWNLEDLYEFPHTFSQAHSFIYCLDFDEDENNAERVNFSLTNYPWQGGYSYTNIYTVFQNRIHPDDRPKIAEIKYASPGWIDILMNPIVALKVAQSVGILIGCGVAAVEAYKRIDKARLEIAYNRKKQQMEFAQFSANETKYINEMSNEIAKNIGFSSLASLQKRTGNPEVTLKLLLAHNRRLRKLADYVIEGKISLPNKLK